MEGGAKLSVQETDFVSPCFWEVLYHVLSYMVWIGIMIL